MMNGQMRYYCADGRRIPEGHDTEECPPCLRAQRDGIRREYEANVNVDLVARLREMDRRVHSQRSELARMSLKAQGPVLRGAWEAFDAWCMPDLDRSERRFASLVFRAGWQAARRAFSLPDDRASPAPRVERTKEIK
jgi:hypothetical protein